MDRGLRAAPAAFFLDLGSRRGGALRRWWNPMAKRFDEASEPEWGLYVDEQRRDLTARKSIKVKLPIRQHIKLHALKLFSENNISQTVEVALDLYFDQMRRQEQAARIAAQDDLGAGAGAVAGDAPGVAGGFVGEAGGVAGSDGTGVGAGAPGAGRSGAGAAGASGLPGAGAAGTPGSPAGRAPPGPTGPVL